VAVLLEVTVQVPSSVNSKNGARINNVADAVHCSLDKHVSPYSTPDHDFSVMQRNFVKSVGIFGIVVGDDLFTAPLSVKEWCASFSNGGSRTR